MPNYAWKSLPVIWFVMWMVTWPALFADVQANHIKQEYADEAYRRDLGFAMGISLLPPIWIVAPFVTGFYEHGFKFK